MSGARRRLERLEERARSSSGPVLIRVVEEDAQTGELRHLYTVDVSASPPRRVAEPEREDGD